jgi:DnaJ-class molecular chaperone
MTNPTNSQWDAMITAHPDPTPAEMVTCETCKGRGCVTKKGTSVTARVTFPTCPDCGGEGRVEVEEC